MENMFLFSDDPELTSCTLIILLFLVQTCAKLLISSLMQIISLHKT